MALRIFLTPRAESDLRSVREYLIQENILVADEVRIEINSSLARLAEYPDLGRNRKALEVFSFPISHYLYILYYRIENDELVVVHVRHTRRKSFSR